MIHANCRLIIPIALVVGNWFASAAWAAPSRNAPEIEEHVLRTRDGVALKITYYPGSAGRDATPVLMLHDLKESRQAFRSLALRMSQPKEEDTHQPFAVVTVDLRGHGDSVRRTLPDKRTLELDAAKLKVGDYQAMVLFDLEAVRKFLVDQNDQGKLNLNRLSVVGTGLGAAVATNYAAYDWSIKPLAQAKQGQDIKALVLVSPRWKVKGLGVQQALRQPGVRSQIATLILYGAEDRRVKSDVERIYRQLEKYHKKTNSADPQTLPDLLKIGAETKLQGTQCLKQAGKKADDLIIKFLTQQVAEKKIDIVKRRNL